MSAKSLVSCVHTLRMCSPSAEDAHLVPCPWAAGHWYELFILHKAGYKFGRWKIFNSPSLLLSLIQAGFCSAISVSSPYITLKINSCSSISSVPANCSPQNSKPLLDVRSVLLSLRHLCAKGLSCLKYTLSICMAAALHSFIFSAFFFLPSPFIVILQQCPIMVSASCSASLVYVSPIILPFIIFIFPRLNV